MNLEDKLMAHSDSYYEMPQSGAMTAQAILLPDALKIAKEAVAKEKAKWERAMKVLDDYVIREEKLSQADNDHHWWKAHHLRTAYKTIIANYDFKEYLDKKVKEDAGLSLRI